MLFHERLHTKFNFYENKPFVNRTESGELVEVSKTSWKGPVSHKCLTSSSAYLEEFRQMFLCASGANRKGGASSRTIITSTAEFYLTGTMFILLEIFYTYMAVCIFLQMDGLFS